MSDLFDIQLGPDAKFDVKLDGPNPVLEISGDFKIKGLKATGSLAVEVEAAEVLDVIAGLAPQSALLSGAVSAIKDALSKLAPAV